MSYKALPSRRRITSLIGEISSRSLVGGEVHDFIAAAISAGEGFSYVRPGGTESEGMYSFLRYRFLRSKFLSARSYSSFFEEMVASGAGVQHQSRADLDYFCYRYLEATLSSDLMGFGSFAPGALGIARTRAEIGLPVTPFEAVEPIRAVARGIQPWTSGLEGKRVLVIHPFAQSIESQFRRKNEIAGVKDALPDFTLTVIRPPVSLTAGTRGFSTWPSQFNQLAKVCLEKDFDVAIIGAGGYGLPLAHVIKGSGRPALHTAGATQLIFGVLGKRWEGDPEMAKIIDSSWIRPFQEDLVPEMETLDGDGAYN